MPKYQVGDIVTYTFTGLNSLTWLYEIVSFIDGMYGIVLLDAEDNTAPCLDYHERFEVYPEEHLDNNPRCDIGISKASMPIAKRIGFTAGRHPDYIIELKGKKLCICSAFDVVHFGCKCGGA